MLVAPDTKDIKALGMALKLHAKFETIERLARDWIELKWREKRPEDLESDERAKWYDLRDSWERATDALRKSVDKFRLETGFSPVLGYQRHADSMGAIGKVFLGYDSVQAKGYRIIELSYPVWFEELGLPTEEMKEDDVYKLTPAQRMSDEQERTLRESFIEDLREAGIEKFGEYIRRYESTIDKMRTYNENVFRVDALVQTIIRERAIVVAKPPGGPIVPVTAPREAPAPTEAVMPTVPEAPKTPEVPSEVKVKVRVEEGMNPGEYFIHLLYWAQFNSFEVDFSGVLSTQALKDYLEEKEEYIDFRERFGLQGLAEAQVEEELKRLPWPFSLGEEIKVVWTSQDIEFTAKAREWWDAFNKVYTRAELEAFDWERLKTIAKLKGVRVGREKAETVAYILGEAPPAPAPILPPAPVAPAVKPPEKPRPLTAQEISKLQDVYSDALFRQLGRVPPNALATFRVEIDKVRDKTFSEAEDHLLGVARDIVGAFVAREGIQQIAPARRVEAPERPPEERMPFAPSARVPPAKFPATQMDLLKFPRAPTSREQIRLWSVFQFQMQQQGYDADAYRRLFDEYIQKTQFLSWEDLKEKYDFFVTTVMSGAELPPIQVWRGSLTVPTGLKGEIQELMPHEQLDKLIVHYTGVLIINYRGAGEKATLRDLYEELIARGIIAAGTPFGTGTEFDIEVKTAVRAAYDRRDLSLFHITLAEIDDFLSS